MPARHSDLDLFSVFSLLLASAQGTLVEYWIPISVTFCCITMLMKWLVPEKLDNLLDYVFYGADLLWTGPCIFLQLFRKPVGFFMIEVQDWMITVRRARASNIKNN